MSKVITFSRRFPSYHPRKGESTDFVEKFHWWFWDSVQHEFSSASDMIFELNNHLPKSLIQNFIDSIDDDTIYKDAEKGHTIRAGNRFKAGDWFSPRVWSGQPYDSKQIIIAPDIQVKKVWDFDIIGTDFSLSGKFQYALTGDGFDLSEVAKNDGLPGVDFFDWFCESPEFKKSNEFHGQIISWNEKIEY